MVIFILYHMINGTNFSFIDGNVFFGTFKWHSLCAHVFIEVYHFDELNNFITKNNSFEDFLIKQPSATKNLVLYWPTGEINKAYKLVNASLENGISQIDQITKFQN